MFLLLKILSLTPSGLASLSQVADLAFVDTAHENSAHLGLALAQLTHFIFYVPAIHGNCSIHTAGNHVNKSIHSVHQNMEFFPSNILFCINNSYLHDIIACHV